MGAQCPLSNHHKYLKEKVWIFLYLQTRSQACYMYLVYIEHIQHMLNINQSACLILRLTCV